jgi:3D (Asp-Asp-Asp) domain-containing protein
LSTQGSMNRTWIAGGIAVLGLSTLNVVRNGAPVETDNPSNRSEAQETVKTIEQREQIPYPTLRKSSSELRGGTSKTVRAGVNGEKRVTYKVHYKGDAEVRREQVSDKVTRHSVPEILAVGQRGSLPSRGYFSGRRVFTMIATGYSPSPAENGGNRSGRTAIGLKIGHGVVAVDPRFIPLGSRLYIEGYGYAIAADTGGAIKGNRIDLGEDSYRKAQQVGRRQVKVHILD